MVFCYFLFNVEYTPTNRKKVGGFSFVPESIRHLLKRANYMLKMC